MFKRLFLGNKLIRLNEVNSTNDYLKEVISNNPKEIEGLVVVAKKQFQGRGQKGTVWKSDEAMNLTFSFLLRPNIKVNNQFIICKIVSLGVSDFLKDLGLNAIKIKWPNDIYCNDAKISGILIENTIRSDRISHTVIGVGLNVNQLNFSLIEQPTSILKELGGNSFDLDDLLKSLLFFIERRYIVFRKTNQELINKEYLENLYWLNESKKFKIKNKIVEGFISGVTSMGQLEVKTEQRLEILGLKEIEFLNE